MRRSLNDRPSASFSEKEEASTITEREECSSS